MKVDSHRKSSLEGTPALDLKRLENVRQRGSKIVGACPACREEGRDSKGEHLAVMKDGEFGCVVYSGDTPAAKEHRRRIRQLAGTTTLSLRPSTSFLARHPRPATIAAGETVPALGVTLPPPPRLVVSGSGAVREFLASVVSCTGTEIALAVEANSNDSVCWLVCFAPPSVPSPTILDLRSLEEDGVALLTDWLTGNPLVVHDAQRVMRTLWQRLPASQPERLNFWCARIAARLLTNGLDLPCDLPATVKQYLRVTVAHVLPVSTQQSFDKDDGFFTCLADRARYLLALKVKLLERLDCENLSNAYTLERRLLPVTYALNVNGWAVDKATLDSAQEQVGVWRTSGRSRSEANSLATQAAHVQSWARHLDPRDGRLRCTYDALGTVTGRYSATAPNLQGVPRGELRTIFRASDDNSLVIGDLGQIELRIAAIIAGERNMIEAFRHGDDLHRQTAAAIFRKNANEVTGDERRKGKAANFGLIFGQGVAGFVGYAGQQGINLEEEEAGEIRRLFFRAYPQIAQWHKAAWSTIYPGAIPVCRTLIGRRRYLRSDCTEWDQFQAHINYRIQGSAADLFKYALILLHPCLGAYRARLVGVVHDEAILETPAGHAQEVGQLMQAAFERAFRMSFEVTLKARFQASFQDLFQDRPACEVQVSTCDNWSEKR